MAPSTAMGRAWISQTIIHPPPAVVVLTPIEELIAGLTSDGIFERLDRLWVFAQNTTAEALTDFVAGASATAVNAPTFTANRGYTGNGSSQYIDSNFNPTTAPSPKYVQDDACFFAWNNTSGTDPGGVAGWNPTAGNQTVSIFPAYVDNNMYWSVNANLDSVSFDGRTGLYVNNRTGASASTIDVNGVQEDSSANASSAPLNTTLVALAATAGGNYSARQCCCLGFGQSLTAGQRSNLYSRLRTYMTAVGVP